MSAVACMSADGDDEESARDAAARAFLEALPQRLRVVRARSAFTREAIPARSGCGEGEVALGEAAQAVWDAERSSAAALAGRYRALAALIEHEGGIEGEGGVEGEGGDVEPLADVDTLRAATALRITQSVARWELLNAHRAVDQLPLTLARMEEGDFPSWWFQKVLSESEDLSDESRRLLDEALSAWSSDIPAERFLTLLNALVTLLAEREKQPEQAEEELVREVELVRDSPSGVASAALRGPIPDVLAFWKRLDETAHAIQAAQRKALKEGTEIPYDLDGIVTATRRPVPLARLRYDLLLNAEFDTDGVDVPAPRFRVNVTVPLFTALGISDAPGMVDGSTPIPPAVARELAGSTDVWYRILTDPCSGEFLPLPAQRYSPSRAMLEHLRLRNSSCAMPGCTRPVSWASEADHIEEYDHVDPAAGGLTEIENLHLLCWQHHQAKTAGELDPTRLPRKRRAPGEAGEPGRTRWRIGSEGDHVITADDIDLGTRLAVRDLEDAWREHVRRRSGTPAPTPPPEPWPDPPPAPDLSPPPPIPPGPWDPDDPPPF
ncbi:HNH endonuclease signature motif containing protein [Brachybacterium aquaticum]|uniref:HNH domain-containing protein n=1 Tax=Brachybacterium aquaticum TaxID=1432564 RepID=A0A841ABA3_9MICO|nr:HNH endonuclease signature motif containing protein [Brachybacterium aquaticum]MBB5831227.1 hypothetical protein [Brachybacterium aquaticum]